MAPIDASGPSCFPVGMAGAQQVFLHGPFASRCPRCFPVSGGARKKYSLMLPFASRSLTCIPVGGGHPKNTQMVSYADLCILGMYLFLKVRESSKQQDVMPGQLADGPSVADQLGRIKGGMSSKDKNFVENGSSQLFRTPPAMCS